MDFPEVQKSDAKKRSSSQVPQQSLNVSEMKKYDRNSVLE